MHLIIILKFELQQRDLVSDEFIKFKLNNFHTLGARLLKPTPSIEVCCKQAAWPKNR